MEYLDSNSSDEDGQEQLKIRMLIYYVKFIQQ